MWAAANDGLQLRRAISIQAEGTRLLEKPRYRAVSCKAVLAAALNLGSQEMRTASGTKLLIHKRKISLNRSATPLAKSRILEPNEIHKHKNGNHENQKNQRFDD
jgi:hypothetical protein